MNRIHFVVVISLLFCLKSFAKKGACKTSSCLAYEVQKLATKQGQIVEALKESKKKLSIISAKSDEAWSLSKRFEARVGRIEDVLDKFSGNLSTAQFGPKSRFFCGVANKLLDNVGQGFGRTQWLARADAVQDCVDKNSFLKHREAYHACNQKADMFCSERDFKALEEAGIEYDKVFACTVSGNQLASVGQGHGPTESEARAMAIQNCLENNRDHDFHRESCSEQKNTTCGNITQ